MHRTSKLQSIVLRAMDVGEADRFCVLFTRERGRLSGRAYGVRKPKSKMGGTLLPFRHIWAECAERDAGMTIATAVDQGDLPPLPASFPLLVRLERGIELLLVLTEEDHPLPEVFDLLLEFIHCAITNGNDVLPAFELRLLHLLGLLPANTDDPRFKVLPAEARKFVEACASPLAFRTLIERMPDMQLMQPFLRSAVEDQLSRPLKSSIEY